MKWYQDKRSDDSVVLSSRVRLARNISGFPFPKKCSAEKKQEICRVVKDAVEKYACEMELDSLPDPDQHYKTKKIKEQYRRFMELRRQMRNQMREAPT